MKKLLYLFLFIAASQHTFAQECKLKGTVSDENGIPVTDASVSIFDSKNEGKGFVFTSNVGEFEFKLPCGQKYDVEIEQAGYETHVENVDLTENANKKIKLVKGKEISLKETIVKAQQAIKIKGDTIEFDADSFKVGNEETLEDILKKLPGIEVVNGKVMYKGKPMSQVTVGGREVLGGNEKLLNKNLPSDAVSKIQLNTKFKSNPFASSLQEDDEQFSLNIELKEEMKRLAFGNVTIGGDADKHTDAQAKIFYFSEKSDATTINDFNTFGKHVFDQDDYMTFFGGMSSFMNDGSQLSIRGGTSGFMFPSESNAPDMNTYNGALHYGVEPNKKLRITGFGLVNTNNIKYNSKVERFYNSLDNPFTTVDEQRNKNNTMMGMARIKIDYNPNDKGQIKYNLDFNYLKNEDEQSVDSYKNGQKDGFRYNLTDRQNFRFSQNLSYIRKIGRDDNIGFYLRHQLQHETPDYQIFSKNEPFKIFGDLTKINDQYNLNQNQEYNVNTFQLYSVYNHLLTNTSNIKFKIGTNFSFQDFENSLYDYQTLVSAPKTASDTNFDYNETFGDVTLTKKFGNFQADLGAGLTFFTENANYFDGTKAKFNETKILPHGTLSYKFSNATSIRASYDQKYQFPNAKDLTDSYVLQSYFSVFEGNRGLRQTLSHNASLSFGHYNSFKFFSFSTWLSYSKNEKGIVTSSTFNQENQTQINTLLNSDYTNENYSVGASVWKRLAKWYDLRLNANLNFSDYYTYTGRKDDNTVKSINNTSSNQSYNLVNTFTFKKKFELKAGLNLNISNFKALYEQKFTTWRPNAEAAWSATDKLLVQSDFSYRLQYRDGEEINSAKEWNASVRYNIAKKTYLTVTGGNLLGNNIIVSSANTDNYISTTTRNVLGRYFIVSLRYKF